MCSMLMLGDLGASYSPRKIWKTDPLRLNLRAFQGSSHACMHACYVRYMINSYSYCVDRSGICMLNLRCCICSIFGSKFPQRSKNWAKLLSMSLPSSFRGHPGLAKYHTVWATFSWYFLLDPFSLACAIRRLSAYIRCHGCFQVYYKSPQQLDCRENWIYAYRIHQFSQNDHPSSIDL